MIVAKKDIVIGVFVALTIILFVLLIIGIVKMVEFNHIKKCIERTISNTIFCPDNSSNPECKLIVNLNLPIPDNKLTYDVNIAHFACNLLGCLELTFQTDKTEPVVLPYGVTLLLQITYKEKVMAIVCTTQEAVWLCLRGTQGEEEWKQNLMIEQVNGAPHFQGLIHKGFLNIYNNIKNQLFGILEKEAHKNLYIVGHSLGSALAQLLLADASFVTPFFTKQLYIFGAPRIGNSVFTQSQSDMDIYRFVNYADIVTLLPPSVSPNFTNPDNVFLYDQKEKLQLNFNDNRSSYYQNHALQCYLAFFNQPT